MQQNELKISCCQFILHIESLLQKANADIARHYGEPIQALLDIIQC